MATATATRRLAAIPAADVVGYSRLMGADEEGTHERFKAHLDELVDPKIRDHHGWIVDVVCRAGEIQRAMADRDLNLAEERRVRFRIGVNLGDVIADPDGLNIVARLQALPEPGSICISGTVRDHVGDRLPYAFEGMGEQRVKSSSQNQRAATMARDDNGLGDGVAA
jgi:class 3 adenylate cyclase